MELLLTKNPLLASFEHKCVQDYFVNLVNEATTFNIATGFITNDSIATLQQIIDIKSEEGFKMNLFIGMNYLEGFTKAQYKAIDNLSNTLVDNNIGDIYLSPQGLFHGKMYSFLKENRCLGGFVGSSNLGSFVGKTTNYIESDVFFQNEDGRFVNDNIEKIISSLGVNFATLPQVTSFKDPEERLLKDYHHVEEVDDDDLNKIKSKRTGKSAIIDLKTEAKSNLNTYFGKGKIKGKYSPRGWYEVELIISTKNKAIEDIPSNGPFPVVTSDKYMFKCERQGDYGKNFRSSLDLKILGRWIKGKMENDGVLEIGKPVTREVLQSFGYKAICLEETSQVNTDGEYIWYLSLI